MYEIMIWPALVGMSGGTIIGVAPINHRNIEKEQTLNIVYKFFTNN